MYICLVDGRMVISAEALPVPLVAQSRHQLVPNQIIKLAIMNTANFVLYLSFVQLLNIRPMDNST